MRTYYIGVLKILPIIAISVGLTGCPSNNGGGDAKTSALDSPHYTNVNSEGETSNISTSDSKVAEHNSEITGQQSKDGQSSGLRSSTSTQDSGGVTAATTDIGQHISNGVRSPRNIQQPITPLNFFPTAKDGAATPRGNYNFSVNITTNTPSTTISNTTTPNTSDLILYIPTVKDFDGIPAVGTINLSVINNKDSSAAITKVKIDTSKFTKFVVKVKPIDTELVEVKIGEKEGVFVLNFAKPFLAPGEKSSNFELLVSTKPNGIYNESDITPENIEITTTFSDGSNPKPVSQIINIKTNKIEIEECVYCFINYYKDKVKREELLEHMEKFLTNELESKSIGLSDEQKNNIKEAAKFLYSSATVAINELITNGNILQPSCPFIYTHYILNHEYEVVNTFCLTLISLLSREAVMYRNATTTYLGRIYLAVKMFLVVKEQFSDDNTSHNNSDQKIKELFELISSLQSNLETKIANDYPLRAFAPNKMVGVFLGILAYKMLVSPDEKLLSIVDLGIDLGRNVIAYLLEYRYMIRSALDDEWYLKLRDWFIKNAITTGDFDICSLVNGGFETLSFTPKSILSEQSTSIISKSKPLVIGSCKYRLYRWGKNAQGQCRHQTTQVRNNNYVCISNMKSTGKYTSNLQCVEPEATQGISTTEGCDNDNCYTQESRLSQEFTLGNTKVFSSLYPKKYQSSQKLPLGDINVFSFLYPLKTCYETNDLGKIKAFKISNAVVKQEGKNYNINIELENNTENTLEIKAPVINQKKGNPPSKGTITISRSQIRIIIKPHKTFIVSLLSNSYNVEHRVSIEYTIKSNNTLTKMFSDQDLDSVIFFKVTRKDGSGGAGSSTVAATQELLLYYVKTQRGDGDGGGGGYFTGISKEQLERLQGGSSYCKDSSVVNLPEKNTTITSGIPTYTLQHPESLPVVSSPLSSDEGIANDTSHSHIENNTSPDTGSPTIPLSIPLSSIDTSTSVFASTSYSELRENNTTSGTDSSPAETPSFLVDPSRSVSGLTSYIEQVKSSSFKYLYLPLILVAEYQYNTKGIF